jgi:hypothetical protein
MDQPLHVISEASFHSAMALARDDKGLPTIVMPQRMAKDGRSSPTAKSPEGLSVVGQNRCVVGR